MTHVADIRGRDALIWLAVSAAVPVLLAIVGIAINKPVLETDPHAAEIYWILWALILGLPFICGLLQWYALRRVVPRLSVLPWMLAGIVSLVVLPFATSLIGWRRVSTEMAFAQWRWNELHDGALLLDFMRSLFLGLSLTVMFCGVASLLQCVLLARAARLRWWCFFVSALAGGACAGLIDHLPYFFGVLRHDRLNGIGWNARLKELSILAATGLAFGAGCSYVFLRLRPSGSRLTTIALSGLAIAALVPVSISLVARDHGRTTMNAVVKAFTRTPAADRSSGVEILRHSHDVQFKSSRFPVASFSPDSASFIVMNEKRQLVLVETASGKSLGAVAEPIASQARYHVAWSPDGRLLALATPGSRVAVSAHNVRYRIRMRVFAMPAGTLLGEYQHDRDECFESYAAPPLTFSADGTMLWFACSHAVYPQANDVLAIGLEASTLRLAGLHRFDGASDARGIAALGVTNGAVMYLQQHAIAERLELRLNALDRSVPSRTLERLEEPPLGRGLLLQGQEFAEREVVFVYCGEPAPETSRRTGSICRRISIAADDGNATTVEEYGDARFDQLYRSLRIPGGWRVETHASPRSKGGQIAVVDVTTGDVRQRIDSVEQVPLAVSPDGAWLLMREAQRPVLRLYTVAKERTPGP